MRQSLFKSCEASTIRFTPTHFCRLARFSTKQTVKHVKEIFPSAMNELMLGIQLEAGYWCVFILNQGMAEEPYQRNQDMFPFN